MLKYKSQQYLDKEIKIQAALNAYCNLKDIEIISLYVAASVFDKVSYLTLNYHFKKGDGIKTLADNDNYNIKLNEAQEASLI